MVEEEGRVYAWVTLLRVGVAVNVKHIYVERALAVRRVERPVVHAVHVEHRVRQRAARLARCLLDDAKLAHLLTMLIAAWVAARIERCV